MFQISISGDTVVPVMNGHPRHQTKVFAHDRWSLVGGTGGRAKRNTPCISVLLLCLFRFAFCRTSSTRCALVKTKKRSLRHRGFNPFRLSYVYIRTKSQNRCDSCTYIYVHGLCDQNMGLLPASNRHFTVSPHEVFTCFRSAAGSHFTACWPMEEKWSLLELSAVFGEFWKITIVGPSSIHRLAWNTMANYMDFLLWKWS